MPNLNDYMNIMDRRTRMEMAALKQSQDQQLPRLALITHKAQTVLDHPGWQMFADKLATRIKEVEARRAATAQRMVTGTEMGHDLELLKINLNAMDAEIAGLQYAASLIPEAISAVANAGRASTSLREQVG